MPDGCYLLDFYKEFLEIHHKKYISDSETETRIRLIGDWLSGKNDKPGLLLSGIPGAGKSTLLKTLKNLITSSELDDPITLDYYGKYAPVSADMISSYELVHTQKHNEKEYERLMKTSILIVDDIGIEPVETSTYGNCWEPLTYLWYYRYEHQLMTIFSTNLIKDEIVQRYGKRFFDRINESMLRVGFVSKNFREG